MRIFLSIFLLLLIFSCQKDKLGCTSETAENYNQEATTDDGTCVFTTPLPSTYSTSITVFNYQGNYTCGYIDIILKKSNGTSPTILLNGISNNEPYLHAGTFQELVDLGYETGDSLRVDVTDCNWVSYATQTRLIPFDVTGNAQIYFNAFLVQ